MRCLRKQGLMVLMACLLCIHTLQAADGFREFQFGDSPAVVERISRGLCQYGGTIANTRWHWKSRAVCRDYRFKEDTTATLYFFFSEDELTRIHVVSRYIPDYLLLRHSNYQYLTPKTPPAGESQTSSNLADRLLYKDNIHQLGDEYRYITFFHEGRWEWEYIFELKGHAEAEAKRKKEVLEEEAEAGIAGWNQFNFNESQSAVKEKLEGVCSQMEINPGTRIDTLWCKEYPFLEEKIDLFLIFASGGLSMIELRLSTEWYETLVPLLKKKYGMPYRELKDNDIYYPSIEFPKANVAMIYKRSSDQKDGLFVVLKYLKRGFEDVDLRWKKGKAPGKEDEQARGEKQRILDSI